MREVSADKAYSGRDHYAIVESKGATAFIPFRSNARAHPKSPTWTKMCHSFALNREDFCAHYHKRSNVEAAFSMIKRVFGDAEQDAHGAGQRSPAENPVSQRARAGA